MQVDGKHYRTIWVHPEDDSVIQIIDQRHLPHQFVIEDLTSVTGVALAIRDMHVRGAGLIGATAGYGMYLAALHDASDNNLKKASRELTQTRPTAVNLSWAVDRQLKAIAQADSTVDRIQVARQTAEDIANEDVDYCRSIGEYGLELIRKLAKEKGSGPLHILTHCNAGWLAFVDHGSATAPMYAAHDAGIDIHVWVDETRPRNQGARLTAWELGQHGVAHTVIPDNTGGHLMQHGLVDLVLTGTDRTTSSGDVVNKIGTYLKALAARDNDIPFYVALPSSTFDWKIKDALAEVPIEQRGADEVAMIQGLNEGQLKKVLITPPDSPLANYAFDVTPANLVTGLITERGICAANRESIGRLFPEYVINH